MIELLDSFYQLCCGYRWKHKKESLYITSCSNDKLSQPASIQVLFVKSSIHKLRVHYYRKLSLYKPPLVIIPSTCNPKKVSGYTLPDISLPIAFLALTSFYYVLITSRREINMYSYRSFGNVFAEVVSPLGEKPPPPVIIPPKKPCEVVQAQRQLTMFATVKYRTYKKHLTFVSDNVKNPSYKCFGACRTVLYQLQEFRRRHTDSTNL